MTSRYTWRTGVFEIFMLAVAAVFLFPVYVLIATALKPAGDTSDRLSWPENPTFDNFVRAWESADLGSAFVNSLIVTVASIALLVVVGALACYPLARITAGWSRTTYYLVMLGFIIPFQLALIPLYVTFRDLSLLGSVWSLVIYYGGLQAPFTIFLFTEFMRSIPRDYDEAASIDGANRLQTFWHVLFPMLRPITGTVIILNTVTIWNDFYAPLLFLSGSGAQTLPLAVFQFTGTYGSQWNLVFASLILGAIPVLAAFLVMQKAVFRGYASGIKG